MTGQCNGTITVIQPICDIICYRGIKIFNRYCPEIKDVYPITNYSEPMGYGVLLPNWQDFVPSSGSKLRFVQEYLEFIKADIDWELTVDPNGSLMLHC